jgi:hypothetical protein
MKIVVSIIFALIGGTTCMAQSQNIFTLYRTSLIGQQMRVHVATFDTANGGEYNQENCETARQLFQSQPEVKTRFWCEGGRYRKEP